MSSLGERAESHQVVNFVAPGKCKSMLSLRTHGLAEIANTTAPAFSLLQCAYVVTASGVGGGGGGATQGAFDLSHPLVAAGTLRKLQVLSSRP